MAAAYPPPAIPLADLDGNLTGPDLGLDGRGRRFSCRPVTGSMKAATATQLPTATSVRLRLARIEGQAAGLRRMWDEERPAEELLDQIAAVRAALRGVALEIVHDTAEARLRAAPATTDHADSLDDVLTLVDRLLRCR